MLALAREATAGFYQSATHSSPGIRSAQPISPVNRFARERDAADPATAHRTMTRSNFRRKLLFR